MLQFIIEFTRYGLTGILSLVVYLGCSNLLHVLGSPIWFATGAAWTVSALVSYFGHIHFSYKVTAEHKKMSYRFMIMLAFHFLLTAGITYVLSSVIKLPYLTTTVITVMITPIASFPIGKYYVFKEVKHSTPSAE